jgi:predicted porin
MNHVAKKPPKAPYVKYIPSPGFLTCGAALLFGFCANAFAQSSVAMYGVADVAMAFANNHLGSRQYYVRNSAKDASRFGFRGTEGLGSGTELIFTLEAGYNIDDGTASQPGSLFNRQSFIGVNHARFGTLTIGRQYSPYWQLLSPIGPIPALTGALGAHPGDIDGFDVTVRHSNAVKYMSPILHGVSAGVMIAPGEHAGTTAGAGGALSAAVKYEVASWRFGLGYQSIRNGVQMSGWDTAASSSFLKSPVNAGYVSAKEVQYLAFAAHHQNGPLGIGGSISNVQYIANATSRFADTASFNTGGIFATWQTGSPWLLGAGLSYTRENAANGINDTANYRQFSLQQTYWLTKRTAIYLLEATQRAHGQTLAADGFTVVNAVASLGDSNATTPSSDGKQNIFMIGVRHAF